VDILAARTWIDLVLARSLELRKAGITSIGFDGSTATFAALEPEPVADDDMPTPEEVEAQTLWEHPEVYPSGIVPTLGDDIDDPADFPSIPSFER
jgi:hypothetical protein